MSVSDYLSRVNNDGTQGVAVFTTLEKGEVPVKGFLSVEELRKMQLDDEQVKVQGQDLSAVGAESHYLPFSAHFRTIFHSPHISALSAVFRTFLHNSRLSALFCTIRKFLVPIFHIMCWEVLVLTPGM
ncbi:MAG: hypothetical protein GY820_03295 [Gammaproteobacteria bacterium]|nr:hypothetical protein [Gammaproteobacteria bacterium]